MEDGLQSATNPDTMRIDSLWRYPVKGLSPEALSLVDLTQGCGFPFDRTYAVTDGSFMFDAMQPVPMPKTHFLMLARYERLALLKTHMDWGRNELTIDVLGEPAKSFRLDEDMARDDLAAFLARFIGVTLPGTPKVAHAEGHRFTDVSVHSSALMQSISLINLATVHDLERRIGQKLDPLRFRANVYFAGAEPWAELEWVGKHLRCGDVLMRVIRRTRRCAATCVDLETGTRDVNVPIAIREYKNHNDLGIYAEVLSPGQLHPGGGIEFVDIQ